MVFNYQVEWFRWYLTGLGSGCRHLYVLTPTARKHARGSLLERLHPEQESREVCRLLGSLSEI